MTGVNKSHERRIMMKYFNKKIIFLVLPLIILFADNTMVMGGTNTVVIGSLETGTWMGPSQHSLSVNGWVQEVVGQLCGGTCWGFNPAYATKLNVNTGVYEIIGKAYLPERIYGNKCGYPAEFDISHMKAYVGCRFSITAINLNTGQVIGTLQLNISPDADMNVFQPELFVSPDGAVIYVSYTDDGPYVDVFNGVMYTHITTTTEYNLSEGASFAKDSKYLYTNSIDATKLVKVDAYTGAVIKRTAPLNTIISSNVVRAKLFHDSHAVLAILGYKDVYVYVYDIDTGGLSPSMPAGYTYTYNLSPDDTYLTIEPYAWVKDHTGAGAEKNYTGIVNIYNVATGQKVAGMNISLPTYPIVMGLGGYNINGKAVTSYSTGAIISWPNDHTFIYNTTQKLIYFDIKQNKVIKQLPIVRPWEQAGWKPEVVK